jgi:peptide methionine sulfoxide reductase MsrA
VGTQYRSIMLCHDETQKAAALASLRKAQAGFAGYCRVVITPKLKKLSLE